MMTRMTDFRFENKKKTAQGEGNLEKILNLQV